MNSVEIVDVLSIMMMVSFVKVSQKISNRMKSGEKHNEIQDNLLVRFRISRHSVF